MTHLPQSLAAAAGAPCMHVGYGGIERCGAADAGSHVGGPRLLQTCSGRRRPSGRLGASTALVSISSCVLRLI